MGARRNLSGSRSVSASPGSGTLRSRRLAFISVVATALAAATALAPNAGAIPGRPLPAAAQGHPYRHGAVPPRGQLSQANPLNSPFKNLAFGGGLSGVGVATGPPKVYLVFWGSQWGAQGTDSNGDLTLAGDPDGMAPYLQEF